jgi:hypothetical protein
MNYLTDWRIKMDDFMYEIKSYARYSAKLWKNCVVNTNDSIFNK